ncbi:GyrI-like domain-containing protein [Hoeflea alexandrii]|uniref:GyrI-like domain-containing protein n=1 Tax=Hoeflea alexandrii TaxID=288436 RepID=UPI003CCD8116
MLTHKGPYAELAKAYHWFFGPWLAASGESAGPAPAVERYLNTPLDAAPTELLTEIHMQLG